MICINTNISKKLNNIDGEIKAIYHSKDTFCFYIFKNREQKNEFIKKINGMNKNDREIVS